MKKSHTLRSICLLASLIGSAGTAVAGPYEPEGRLTYWLQNLPGATTGLNLPLRVFGDEYFSRTETLSGYTVIYRPQTNGYAYAKLSDDGTALIPTEITASAAPTPEIVARGKHLDLSPTLIFQKTSITRDTVDSARRARWNARVQGNAVLRGVAAGKVVTAAQLAVAKAAAAPFQAAPLFSASQPSPFTPGSIVSPNINGIVGLTIMVEFSDVKFPAAITRDKVVRFFNTGTPGVAGSSARPAIDALPGIAGGSTPPTSPPRSATNTVYTEDSNAGSVFNYFYDQSGGRLNYVQMVSPVVVQLGTRDSYNYSNKDFGEVDPDSRSVGSRIVNAALGSVAQSQYAAALSVDGNKRVFAVNIIVAGGDSGIAMRGIWPHTGVIPTNNIGTDLEPRNVTEYSMYVLPTQSPNTAPPAAPTSLQSLLTIGTFCRENAKMLLGCPDLYAYPNVGVGNQCLMGTGAFGGAGNPAVAANAGSAAVAWNEAQPMMPISPSNGGRRPAPLNPHFRDLLGWNTVTQVLPNAVAETTVKVGVGNLPTTYPVLPTVYIPDTVASTRVSKSAGSLESFMFSSSGNGDKWAVAPTPPSAPLGITYTPLATGVLIWHIDDAKDGNTYVSSGEHFGVALEQADGLFDLEGRKNFGDLNDSFSLSKPSFSDVTLPDAKWWDNTSSGIQARITALDPVAPANAKIAFGGFIPLNTIVVDTPNGGETAYWKNTIAIRWRANVVGKLKIELFKGGVFYSIISASEINDKQYDWLVPNTLPPGADYTIKVSSLTNPTSLSLPTQVSDISDAVFSISDSAFPKGEVIPYGWVKSAGSINSWAVTSKDSVDGSYSLATIKPRDGSNTGIEYKSNFVAGTVSFYLKVSTEANSDVARFYIYDYDSSGNVVSTSLLPQLLDGGDGVSGQSTWVQYTFPVTAGTHTFKWTYEKDDSFGGLSDSVFLDAVKLPATTQEIAVEVPVGTNIESGVGTISFPDTTIGSTSIAQTFTIKNTGSADLFGISLTKSGAAMADFVVSAVSKSVVLPGQSATFTVALKPTVVGAKVAALTILSNDADESNFVVALQGNALGLPLIAVSEPSGPAMIDGKAKRSFGSAPIGSTGMTQIYTITNNGAGQLNGLAVTKSGTGATDYVIGALSSTVVAPSASATFSITFRPTALKTRTASIVIASNDAKSGPYNFTITGTGTAAPPVMPLLRNGASVLTGSSISSSTISLGVKQGIEVTSGLKYNSVTLTKGANRTVEVSSNLLDWYSGIDFTTVLFEDNSVLKVRDNTPASGDAKRYIRVK